ncbi:hypothetical protein GCM10009504_47470 [Pseudomonas laurentiana]|nr:hypothetical protein GCM10009504_47470 [Pseudomonas laurentiana]
MIVLLIIFLFWCEEFIMNLLVFVVLVIVVGLVVGFVFIGFGVG